MGGWLGHGNPEIPDLTEQVPASCPNMGQAPEQLDFLILKISCKYGFYVKFIAFKYWLLVFEKKTFKLKGT